MADKNITYKISFKESDQTLNNVIQKLKEIANSSGVSLSDSFKGDLRKLDTLLPPYKKKLEDLLSFDKIELFDLKSLTKDFNTISNLAKKLLTNLSQQILPKTIADQIESITKEITQKTTDSKRIGGELVSRKSKLVRNESGAYIDLTDKEKNRITAKELGSVTIGTDVLTGYDQLIAKREELERLNKQGSAEWAQVTEAIKTADSAILKHKETLEQEIKSREAEREAIIASRDALKEQLNVLSDSSVSDGTLTDEQKKSLQDLSKALIDIDNANSSYNKGLEQTVENETKNVRVVNDYNKAENKKAGTLKRAAVQVFSYGTALRLMRNTYQQLINTVTKMDEALTGMAVVTNMSREDTYKLVGQLQDLADATGMATTEIANMATMYYQQGKSTQQVIQLTEAAAKAATIAGISGEESINLLTNAMNGFQMSASRAMEVSDKFAALAAASATDYEELATALSKVAAQANLAGMSMDFTLGLIAKGIEVTREAPETIGTSLKTVIARMRELTDYGVTLEDGMDVNRVAKAFANIGVEMMDEEGQFRDLEDVLTEVGKKWDTLSVNQKANVAVAAAGTRQQSRFIAMMQDFDRTLELVNISANSYGATLSQQAKYMEGIEAKTTLMKNAFQQMIMEISNSKVIISALESITWALDNWKTVSLALIPVITTLLALKIASIAATIAQLGGIKALTIAKLLETKATWAAVAANIAWLASNPIGWILAGVTAIGALVAGISIYVASLKTAEEATQENIDAVAKLQIKIYELENTYSNLTKITDSFDELSNKIVKTSEDLDQLIELAQQYNDTAGLQIIDTNASYSTQQQQMHGYNSLQESRIEEGYKNLDAQLGYNWTAKDELEAAEQQKRWSARSVAAGISTALDVGVAGAATGAAIGARIGTVGGPLGSVIIGYVGGVLGGIGGLIGGAFAGDAVSKEMGELTEEEKEKVIQEARDRLYNDKTQIEGLRQSVVYFTDSKEYSSQVQDIIGKIATTKDSVNNFLKEDGYDYEAFLSQINSISSDSKFAGMNFQTALESVLDSGKLSDYKELLDSVDDETSELLSSTIGYFNGLENISIKAIENFDSLGYTVEQVNKILSSAAINAKALNISTGEYIDKIYGSKDNFTKYDSYQAFINSERETSEIKKRILSGDTEGLENNQLYLEYTEATTQVNSAKESIKPLQDKIDKGEELTEKKKKKYQGLLAVIGSYQQIINEVQDTEIDWATGTEILGIKSVSALTEEITSLTSSMQRLNKVNNLNNLTFEEQMELLQDYPELYDAMQKGVLSLEDQEEFYQKEYDRILGEFDNNIQGASIEFSTKLNLDKNMSVDDILNITEDSQLVKDLAASNNMSVSEVWDLIAGYQTDIKQNKFGKDKLEELGVQGLIEQSNLELIQAAKDVKEYNKLLVSESEKSLELLSEDSDKYIEIQNKTLLGYANIIKESKKGNEELEKQFKEDILGNKAKELEKYYKIVDGEFIILTEELEKENEDVRKSLEASLNQAAVSYNDYADQVQENNDDMSESYEKLASIISQNLEKEQEELIETLEKRKEAYEDYFDKIDSLQEEEDNNKNRENLIKQIEALSGANDSASKQRLKELKEELNDLNEDSLQTQIDEQRNAIIEGIEDKIEKEQETLDKISGGVAFISSLLAEGKTSEIEEVLRGQGFSEDEIKTIMGQLQEGYSSLIPGYSTGGQVTHTGLALVHGTVTNPEAFLSAKDNATIQTFLSILNSVMDFNGTNDIEDSEKSIIIENIAIQTNQLNNNQDFKNAGKILAEEFAKAIQKRGISQNVKK